MPSGLQSIDDFVMSKVNVECPICGGFGWVCENHPNLPWDSGHSTDCKCGGAGMPCRCTGITEARPPGPPNPPKIPITPVG